MTQQFIRLSIVLCLIYASFSSAIGQETDSISYDQKTVKQKTLSLSLSSFMKPLLPGPLLSYQYKDGKDRYWNHQVGLFLNLGFVEQNAIEHLRGIKLASGLRKYRSKNNFVEFSLDYQYVDVLIGADFWRDGFNYTERLNYNMWQHSLAFNFIVGTTAHLSKHLQLDIGIGLGAKLNHRQYSPIPDDARFSTNGSIFLWRYYDREKWNGNVSAPIIVSLGYAW